MDVKKIAELAHLEITDDEAAIYQPQMEQIVSYVEQLKELSLDGVEPMLGGLTDEGEKTPALRADEVRESLPQSEALKEAPAVVSGHFQVPKVL